MLLKIIHETRYAYAPEVETAQHMAHLKPRATPSQRLLDHALAIDPAPALQGESSDIYGNTRTFFAFDSAHTRLLVAATSTVQTETPLAATAPARGLAWGRVQEQFSYRKGAVYDAAAEFVFPSPYVLRDASIADYARRSFQEGRSAFDAAMELTERIHGEFEYDPESTEINTPAAQALAQRRGVCQDFAHIMIGCLRSCGIPARYVSGYLLTQPPPGRERLIGADASHAWVSMYVPHLIADVTDDRAAGRWIDFDPTNGRQAGEDYVTLAVGRDYSDVSPMRGVLHGGARHKLKVAVTVLPVDAPAGQPPSFVLGNGGNENSPPLPS